jgi:hypothetical protein
MYRQQENRFGLDLQDPPGPPARRSVFNQCFQGFANVAGGGLHAIVPV